mmetsp:Transcript_13809/g.28480  ORF Transcript_13809/g.28480 Transcript_13809/m.28480 type:complete len:619 (+) Transcript_13809:145-2001(+)
MFGIGQNKESDAEKAVDTVKVNKQVLLQTGGSSSKKELVGSIDQGTSSTRFLLFTKEGKIAAWAQKETTQIFPTTEGSSIGWHEHDPLEIWKTVKLCIQAVCDALDREVKQHNHRILSGYEIAAIGITNQRETTVAWNAETGQVYHNAIVWDDTRTVEIASNIAQGNDDRLRKKTGLPLASYFAGTKVRWLLDNVESLRYDLSTRPQAVRFGTIDTWIVYQLTGAPALKNAASNVGGLFVTDVSNASRWLFLDIHAVQWSQELLNTVCGPHKVPLSALPEVKASSEVYATLKKDSTGVSKLQGVPLSAILGDQQAALFGQVAFEPGEAKNTYGTGMFLMMNTGSKLVPSKHGLLTTIAYKVNNQVVYALEGSVSHSGSTIQWLRDQLEIIESAPESETIATETNDGLYLVPAFAGLFAPHWRPDARGCIVGITAAHHKGHFARAALEAAAYQCRELFEAIRADSGVDLKALKVDGGGSHNKLLMQFQADMIQAPVVIPEVQETTAMGAAFAAGLAVGFYKDPEEIRALWTESQRFDPKMEEAERQQNWSGWKKAIARSLDWVDAAPSDDTVASDHFWDAEEGGESEKKSTTANNSGLSLLLLAGLAGAVGFYFGRQKR